MSAFDMAVGMCQLALAELQTTQQEPLTREQISEKAAELLEMPMFRATVNLESLVGRLEEIFTVWANDPRSLNGDDDHLPWFPAKRGDFEWRFWNRYKLYLIQDQKMAPAAVVNVEKLVDDVLGRLEDPVRPGPWDRRGLVMGNVQSGKTGAYTGLVCKAADAGYKVIIILAGLHNNLRSQTQIRLDEGFLGYRAAPPGATGGFSPVGVHRYGPGLHADSVTNRNEDGDFRHAIAKHFAIHPGGNPLLFVVKKNVTVLKNLLAWIAHSSDASDPQTGRKYHRNTPLLIIDDESDQASIDTKRIPISEDGTLDLEHDPTKTNKLMRSLLYAFDKSAYVGFTATPFANIFIHEQAKTTEHGEDLFPRSFILNLPAPSNYIGAARVFGIEGDDEAGLEAVEALPIFREIDDHAVTLEPDETGGWMPPKLVNKTTHIPLVNGARAIPESLRRAVMCFILSCAVRSLREQGPVLNSMLVHVVRFTAVQEIIKEEIEQALREMVSRLELGDGDRRPSLVDEFRSLWNSDFIPTSLACGQNLKLPKFEAVSAILRNTTVSVVVKSINGSALDALDYELHRSSGLNVIAVGGDKLSRGLTLEGLTVSYFLRASRMYDTLMQMGRWFGYREKYIDLCRLFTTKHLRGWFRYIAAASEELKQEFDYMVSIGATPRQYGLRVRSHPELLVTSQVKMRSGTEMRLSYQGQISETVTFDLRKAAANKNALIRLLDDLGKVDSGKREGGYTWRGLPVETILEFLSQYDAAGAPKANPQLWGKYIKRQNEQGELTEWMVRLASSGIGRSDDSIGGLDVGLIERKADDTTPERHTIGRLVNPADEALDLDEKEEAVAMERTLYLWERNTRKDKSLEPPRVLSGRGIRFARSNKKGLLLIYPLDEQMIKDRKFRPGMPLVGVAISFPESKTARDIGYVVTTQYAEDMDFGE